MAASSRQVYTVAQISEMLRGLLETSLPSVSVQGELSNFRNPAGHWYFTLKDDRAQISCVMFKSRNFLVRPAPRDGDGVIIRGQVSFYPAQGRAQIIVDHLEPAGEGLLLRQFEELKRKLAAEGLFDEKLKRPLPEIPRGIGIVTSGTGAALQDILTTLRRRFPLGSAYVYPVPVQGDAACPAMVRALAELPRRAPVDVIILARGGGSLEDLWCFNHETLARAIRACAVPVVTGIGHEVDFTIADFAADLRAPTPTGAAERAAPDLAEWREHLERLGSQAAQGLLDRIDALRETMATRQARLDRVHPGRALQSFSQRLDELAERLGYGGAAVLARRRAAGDALLRRLLGAHPGRAVVFYRHRHAVASERLVARTRERLRTLADRVQTGHLLLANLNPRAILERGYAIVRTPKGAVIRDAAKLGFGDPVDVVLARGEFDARVTTVRTDPDAT